MMTNMTADKALEILKDGNIRFANNLRMNRNFVDEVQTTKESQSPFAVVVSCMDSRTSPELIFDRGLGDIFSIRIAGNVITPEIIGSIEYACAAVGSKAVVVLGHTGCGAINGAIGNVQLGSLHTITSRIRACMHSHHSAEEVTKNNVEQGMKQISEESDILRDLILRNEIKVIGGVYDITTGLVSFLETTDDMFIPGTPNFTAQTAQAT